jgi:DNA-binding NtrC family response regulator
LRVPARRQRSQGKRAALRVLAIQQFRRDGALGEVRLRLAPEQLALKEVERRHVQAVLALAGGNKSKAARLLGVDRKTLDRKGRQGRITGR